MSKRKSLDIAALTDAAGETVAPIAKLEAKSAGKAPSRAGKVQMGVFVDPSVRTQIKRIALEQDRSVSALLDEAIEGVLQKYTT